MVEDGPVGQATLILDLSGIRLDELPTVENATLREAVEQVLKDDGQPDGFLGFQSAI
jgi:FXSXX-COOH protein